MAQPDYTELEKQLADNSLSDVELPSTETLADRADKQQRSTEFVRLGVHGIFSMLLSIFAPMMTTHKQKNTLKKAKRS